MANDVFANGREVSCKSGSGKTICAFPDVCFTPPENPATPPGVPVPYPNTGMTSDTTSGSKTVKISGKEVMLKNKSYFKKSMGDEAGCAAKKGVITSVNRGKVYFKAWSMDVKIEGENVVRHLDLTTHNHASEIGQTPPWPFTDSQAMPKDSKCKDDKKKMEDACRGLSKKERCPGVLGRKPGNLKSQMEKSPSKRAADVRAVAPDPLGEDSRTKGAAEAATAEADKPENECVRKSRCQLKPYKPRKRKGEPACCPGQTPHHIPPKACMAGMKRVKGVKKYNKDRALCVCLEGTTQHYGSHGKNHAAIDHLAKEKGLQDGSPCTIAEYNKICAAAVAAQCGCDPACIQQQLDHSLKPTDREIKHVHSTSGEPVSDTTKQDMNKHYDTVSAPSID